MFTMLLGLRRSSVTTFPQFATILNIITTINALNENIIKLFYLIPVYIRNFEN